MGFPESDIRIPEPRDEFRKARTSSMYGGSIDSGFESFRLAQNMGIQNYGVDLSHVSEQEKRDIILVNIAQYISDIELGPIGRDEKGNEKEDKNSAKRNKIFEEIEDTCVLLVNKLSQRFQGFSAIKKFTLYKGVLSFFLIIPPRTDHQVLTINLTEVFGKNKQGKFITNEKVLDTELKGKARQSLDTLRNSLETESLFGGALIVSYETKEQAKKVLGVGLQSLGVAGSVSTLEYAVRRLMFRDEAGKMQEVDPKIVKNILKGIGDKTRINSLMFKIMQANGRVFNPLRSAFTDINTLGIDRATEKVKLLKRADIETGRTMTDTEFEAEKSKMIQELSRTSRSTILQKASEFIKGVPGKLTHYVFWGVFFAEYQKNTYDLANMYRGMAETGLFYAGASVGGRMTPGVWKIPGSLLGGGLSVLGGHMAGGAMNLDKKVWRAMPERVSGSGEKSVASHIFFGGASNDLADRGNRDLGIPGTRGGAAIYNPLGNDGIIPNIDFARTNIDFGVNPREYLQSRVGGTDIHWNKRMDEYVAWSVDQVMKVLWEYEKGSGYFASKNGDKNSLLRERLKHIFDSDGGKNKRNALIIEDCIDYMTKKAPQIADLSVRKEMISLMIGNYASILKIDEASISYDASLLERDKSILEGYRMNYLTLLSPLKRALVEKIFIRLDKGEILVDGKMTYHPQSRGGKNQIFIPNEKEVGEYQRLIGDDTPAKAEWYSLLGYSEQLIDYTNASFSLPNKVVQIDEKRVYFRSYFDILLGEYVDAIGGKKGISIGTLDAKYGLNIIGNGFKNQTTLPNSFELRRTLLENIAKRYPQVESLIVESMSQKSPTQGDVFVHLLNLHTEYREQKRFIENQKAIGYANKWSFL